MAIKTFKPYTPARRNMTVSAFDGVDKKAKPERSLVETLKKNSGRNSYGRITVRHQRRRQQAASTASSTSSATRRTCPQPCSVIEYDPNRSAFIALVKYEDGELTLHPGSRRPEAPAIRSSPPPAPTSSPATACPSPTSPLVPSSTTSSCTPASGAQLVRSAGVAAQLMAKEGESGSGPSALRRSPLRPHELHAPASVRSATSTTSNVHIGKAGRKRHMGIRPTVRGSVMNPCDHPHGGGEGRAPIGRPGPVTPWGKPAMGYKTRKTKNPHQQVHRQAQKQQVRRK